MHTGSHPRRDFLKVLGLGAAALDMPRFVAAGEAAEARPNIVIVMVDDMGFSDIGCYGSEIETPNLDRLAANGLRFTQFYNTARCCPTRASLLTGLYAHQAGVGAMMNDRGPEHPGYRGHLNDRCVTIAEALKPAGYFTAIAGKWHVGDKEKEWWPLQRGFDRFYGVPQGGGFYFRPNENRSVALGNDVVYSADSTMPEGWYTTDAWTDYGIRFIDDALAQAKPFFLYVAHNAPHWPLQAPPEDIAKYKGKYMKGWDKVREERRERLIDMGILDPAWPLTPRDKKAPAWDDVAPEKKEKQDLGMACYAAVVERMDRNVGRLVEALEERGILENTLVMFLSDNGACAEGGTLVTNKEKGEMGSAESHVRYGLAWANASNTPFRLYKHWVHEGGVATPLIAHWPRVIQNGGTLTDQLGHVIDLMATCCDVAGADYPQTYEGRAIEPLEGKSLLPILRGETREGHEGIFFEHEGNRAVRQGKWKLVSKHPGPWELFDMESDRTEMNNLAEQHPERVKELKALYEAFAARAHVEPRPQKPKKPAKGQGEKGNK
jgi:arylsulfatase A-like enzyme